MQKTGRIISGGTIKKSINYLTLAIFAPVLILVGVAGFLLLFAGVIADTLGIETVMVLLAAAMLGFRRWAAWYSHHSFVS